MQEVKYAKVAIERIAARAGVGKQTIYRWWPSRGAVVFDAFLMLSEGAEGEPVRLPDTGDLATEIAHNPELAATYAERLDGPLREAKRERLRSAQQAGQLAEDVDLDVAVDLIWGPPFQRWLHRSGPLTTAYTDRLVVTALDGLRPRR